MENQKFKETVENNKYRFSIDKNGCWIWLQHTNPYDYAEAKINRETILVHRYFYEIYYNKKLTSYIELHHKCEIRKCINPLHLEELSKVGHRHKHLYRKIFEKTIIEIVDLYLYGFDSNDIAKVYKVTGQTIRDILKKQQIIIRPKGGNLSVREKKMQQFLRFL